MYGDTATHSVSYGLHGFAAGGDIEVFDDFRIGGALSYSSTALSTSLAAAGTNEAFSLAAYAERPVRARLEAWAIGTTSDPILRDAALRTAPRDEDMLVTLFQLRP
ncbi:autotransporter domain-containing protein [Reyranella sp.]|uniref:autotransporter domain-containing protein n=1 Tax=Reyranella sp. TaxID=1929291 RepID=UPI003784B40D